MEHLDKTFAQGQTLNAADLNDIVSKINEGVDEFNILAAENMTDTIYLDFTKTSPSQIITGDVNGDVIKWIRKNSHRYLAKKTDEGKMTICQLADGDGTVFAGDGSTAPLDGSQGDVMVHVPRFFYRAQLLAADKWQIDFSPVKVSEAWQEYDGKQLIGAYEGYVNDDKLYSRSGVDSTGNVSQVNFKTYARARGNGYTLTTWEQHCVMAVLFYAQYGNTNSQGVIGSGTNSDQKQTGQTDSLGMEDTRAETNGNTMSINFWGLENWWGNKSEYIDNVSVNLGVVNGVWRITEKDGSTRDVQGAEEGTAGTYYPKSMHVGQHLDMIPKTLGGSSNSSLCDGFSYSPATNRIASRSGNNAGVDCGCVFVGVNTNNSSPFPNIGARLSFAGEIHIEVDVNAFKAL
jgi:hypothetical protein